MIFTYIAKDKSGKTISGEVEAINEKSASNLLRERNLIVISLKPKSKGISLSGLGLPFNRVSMDDKVNFTQQLSTMISAGLTLSKSIRLISNQLKEGKFKEIVETILNDVEGGSSFAASLEKFPDVFPKTYISLVKAGEASGNLDNVLTRLAEILDKQRSFRARVKGALINPVIILIAMVGVIIVILVFVIPKLTQMYESLNIELPLPTKILL